MVVFKVNVVEVHVVPVEVEAKNYKEARNKAANWEGTPVSGSFFSHRTDSDGWFVAVTEKDKPGD